MICFLYIFHSFCGPLGLWDIAKVPECAPVQCGDPPDIPHATVKLLNGSTTWRSLSVYNCLPGFQELGHLRPGETLSQCMMDGTWSLVVMKCKQLHSESKMAKEELIGLVAVSTIGILTILLIGVLIHNKRKSRAASKRKMAKIANQSIDREKVSLLGLIQRSNIFMPYRRKFGIFLIIRRILHW